MDAGVRLRFGGFLVSLAGRKGFTNDAPDWGVFALATYEMNVGSPFVAKAAAGAGAGGAGAPGAGGPGAGGPGAGRARRGGPGSGRGGPGRGRTRRAAAPGRGGSGCRARGPRVRVDPAQVAPEPARPARVDRVRARGPREPADPARAVDQARRARSRASRRRRSRPRMRSAVRDVNFEFDQYSLTDDAKATLDELGQALKANPQFAVTIEGHADERGTVEYNLALAEQRAQAAKAYLVALGVDASRVDTISYGEQQPVDAGHDELAWAINRRAHFLVRGR